MIPTWTKTFLPSTRCLRSLTANLRLVARVAPLLTYLLQASSCVPSTNQIVNQVIAHRNGTESITNYGQQVSPSMLATVWESAVDSQAPRVEVCVLIRLLVGFQLNSFRSGFVVTGSDQPKQRDMPYGG